jgi:hypothetical protein
MTAIFTMLISEWASGKQVPPCSSRDLSFYASLRDEIHPSFLVPSSVGRYDSG